MADKPPKPPAKGAAAAAEGGGGSTKRRDALLALELAVQAEWERTGAFDADAADDGRPKYFVTFPYPYMNGRLHLGHAFSLTKAEFAASFKRLQGYNVLFPFGFHCTGMPIQAAANKLKAEVASFGNPPVFPEDVRAAEPKTDAVADLEKEMAALGKKGKAKKAKVASKSAGTSYQWQALEKMGIPATEIADFAEPGKWLDYFPPFGVSDLKRFGASVDWRRSFITTERNAYYDAFVRWQFGRLKAADKISYGKRANVYSVRDAQCCADHDRASGEGVGPQEYTLIKLRVLDPPACLAACGAASVFLVAATLRPETMYGQTNCYVLPEGDYGAYRQASGEVFVMSHRAAVGLAHQGVVGADGVAFDGYAATWGAPDRVGDAFKGAALMGCPLRGPLAAYDAIYVLPLTTISMGKGTGVVTSVPSDAPDDWIALHELKSDEALRAKYGLEAKHVAFDVVPIIRIAVDAPEDGKKEAWTSDKAAEFWCEKLEIKTQKDAAKLAVAKGETYLNGFNYGVMLVGDHAGAKVSDAKPLVKATLVAAGDALVYFEPESPIMSRSGDECIVAHTEQWYLKYGEADWRDRVVAHVESTFEAYNAECLARFQYTLGWMKEWACSRLFGLGTRIPWDETWVIESLSDSTIYMAYYTIAHVLQGHGASNLAGADAGAAVPAAALTPAVFDYVYATDAPHPAAVDGSCGVPDALLERMRAEFRYWYPMDLRVSGKDLIGNHLTMCLYNHAAIWPDEAATRWPRSMYTNGFVLLDGEKMSKSTGNFLMLDEACQLYGADAVRFALADAGDTLEDANFERKRADGAVNMLYVEEAFARNALGQVGGKDALDLRPRDAPRDRYFVDRAFANEMAALCGDTAACYAAMRWRDGIQAGAFALQLARDAYRDWCARSDVPMHAGLLADYVRLSAALIAPVCPHFAHHVWRDVLGERGPLRWPEAAPVDRAMARSYDFLKKTARALRLDAAKELKALKGKPPAGGYVYVASTYPDWRLAVLAAARAACAGGALVEKKALLGALKSAPAFAKGGPFEKSAKLAMQFGSFMHDYAAEVGLDAFDDALPFDQVRVLTESKAYLSKCIVSGKHLDIEIVDLDKTDAPPGPAKKIANASPGKVAMHLFA